MLDPYARIAFDFKLMRPGCALLQAALGGFTRSGRNPASDFPTNSWLLAPTEDLKLYDVATEEEYQRIVDNYEELRAHHAKRAAARGSDGTDATEGRTSKPVRALPKQDRRRQRSRHARSQGRI